MSLKIQRLQLVLAVLVAVQEHVPAMLNGMVPFPFGPPGRGGPRCIKSHTFGSGDHAIHLKPHCETGCSGEEANGGDKCVGVSGTSGCVLIILSGVCQNRTCKISNESEIYKQEMNVSLNNNDVASAFLSSEGEQSSTATGCGF
uniref:Putative secreted protein n=1 Tax=Ixodes ricinus TaxID=34613 RepID=A0A0K8RBP2_IXORI